MRNYTLVMDLSNILCSLSIMFLLFGFVVIRDQFVHKTVQFLIQVIRREIHFSIIGRNWFSSGSAAGDHHSPAPNIQILLISINILPFIAVILLIFASFDSFLSPTMCGCISSGDIYCPVIDISVKVTAHVVVYWLRFVFDVALC